MKNYLYLAIMLIFATAPSALCAQETGATCENAIVVQNGFSMRIEKPGTYWFTATTFDLPMTLSFLPDGGKESRPVGLGDFTCSYMGTFPIYEDERFYNLMTDAEHWGYEMPLQFYFTASSKPNTYELIVEKDYRDRLSAYYGITEDVRAWIQVSFEDPGLLTTYIDSTFRQCLETSPTFKDKDTIIATPDVENGTNYRLPVVDMLRDSILFEWTGTQPMKMWLGSECGFSLDSSDPACYNYYTFDPSNGTNSLFFSSADLLGILNDNGGSGVYYIRFEAQEVGAMLITLNPAEDADEGAIVLKMNEAVDLPAGLSPLYAFPVGWLSEKEPILWTSSSATAAAKLYLNPEALFSVTNDATTAKTTYGFVKDGDVRVVQWTSRETERLSYDATGTYYYVRFLCSEATKVTPSIWNTTDVSDCVKNSLVLMPSDRKKVTKTSGTPAYRIPVSEWMMRDQDVVMKWEGRNDLRYYIMKTCSGTLSNTSVHKIVSGVLYYQGSPSGSVDTVLFKHEDIAAWADLADADGYVYARFNVSSEGILTCHPVNMKKDDIFPDITITDDLEEVIEEVLTTPETVASKLLRNGQLLILRNGLIYTVEGQLLGK